MIRKFLAVFSACLLLCTCAACMPKEKQSEAPEETAGAPIIFPDAPAEFESVQFETTDLQGNAQSQSIFQENELTMVNIWATWCAPCIEEMPVLEQIYQEGEIGVVGIVIESREEEVAELALEITTQTGATFPILRVTEDMEEGFLSGHQRDAHHILCRCGGQCCRRSLHRQPRRAGVEGHDCKRAGGVE